jgi:hypothetical protein
MSPVSYTLTVNYKLNVPTKQLRKTQDIEQPDPAESAVLADILKITRGESDTFKYDEWIKTPRVNKRI